MKKHSALHRSSMPSNMQHQLQRENSKEEYYEEEEEEEEDDYYAQMDNSDSPFGMASDQMLNSDDNQIDYNDHPLVQSQSQELQTVTLLVIEETLLEDFLVKDIAEQKEREKNKVGHLHHPNESKKEEESPTRTEKKEIKHNLQGEQNEENDHEHKGKI